MTRINVIETFRNALDGTPSKLHREILKFGIKMSLNDECTICERCISNYGPCNGMVGGGPCLGFKESIIRRI